MSRGMNYGGSRAGAGSGAIARVEGLEPRVLLAGAALATEPRPPTPAVQYLARVMDQYHDRFDVYSDFAAAGNHFHARARFNSPGGEAAVPPMDEDSAEAPDAGWSAIRAEFHPTGDNWGGWVFLNGVLADGQKSPTPNFGREPGAGVDLTGATELSFRARGAAGGERVEFFAFGVGRSDETGAAIEPYPDSAAKIATTLTLASQWTTYTLPLAGTDLSYVLGGFGWSAIAADNANDIAFFIDDISYNKPALDAPRLMVSYETTRAGPAFDRVARNTAFTYDNALALIAFLASGEEARAKLLADALVYAQEHDPLYTDGRIRNAYQGGDLASPPGWVSAGRPGAARLPGSFDAASGMFAQDPGQVGTHAGNVAWAMLALLAYHRRAGGEQYLQAAERMGQWLDANCRDTRGRGGYTAGFDGSGPDAKKLRYKSTEQNMALAAAFGQLASATGERVWARDAKRAERFASAMWFPRDGHFWTGTLNNGVKKNFKAGVPLEPQALGVLLSSERRGAALDYAELNLSADGGFDFNKDEEQDGVWYEGTAQMAAAYLFIGRSEKAAPLLEFLHAAQDPASGALPAASMDGLTTGFFFPDKTPWLYYRRPHVGATAWLAIAERSLNPFTGV